MTLGNAEAPRPGRRGDSNGVLTGAESTRSKRNELLRELRIDRICEALGNPDIPAGDRFALAELVVTAYLLGEDSGYQRRIADENGTYPPPPVFTSSGWFDQALERQKWYATARQPRPGDSMGGVVDVW